MIIKVLVENEKEIDNETIAAKHGLSFYIESNGKKILLDVGPNSLFTKNAAELDINLSEVDMVVISHGHKDHGGGISHFLKINSKAKIYMHKMATSKFYTKIFGVLPYYVGLNKKVLYENKNRIHFIEGDFQIDSKTFLISNFVKDFQTPTSNKSLFVKEHGTLKPDSFQHEIVLLVKEFDGNVLFSSCSHSGISNIVKTAYIRFPDSIKAVIGGFHLYNPISNKAEDGPYISRLADELINFNTNYYTCHCTGNGSFEILKNILGSKVNKISAGKTLEI